jgi:RND family efflux transporter MFP subunit
MLPLEATNAVSADDLEQSRSEASIAESDLKNQILMAKAAAATARLRSADLEIARQRLRDCEIRVPQPSNAARPEDQVYTISERMVSEGTLLRTGSEVFRLVLGKTLKLKLFVPEVYTSQIAVGQDVSITVSSSSEPEPGRVARISPSIERATRTFLVEVEVPNESGRCKPGGFAKANILIGKTVDAVTVPPSSVYSLAGIQKIFLIENGIAREHHVTVGQQTRDWIEIATPVISVPSRVITSGQRMLSDGLPVVERQASDAKQAEDESKASFASVPGKEQTK